MTDKIIAIAKFLENNDLHYSRIFKTRVIAQKHGRVIYDDETECTIVEDTRYMQIVLNILWNAVDAVWRNLGLHGTYNTNFQNFKLQDEDLLVTAEQYKIIIKKLGKGE